MAKKNVTLTLDGKWVMKMMVKFYDAQIDGITFDSIATMVDACESLKQKFINMESELKAKRIEELKKELAELEK